MTPKKLRKPAAPKLPTVPEHVIHSGVAQLLHLTCPGYVMWWHTPNGEVRSARTGAKLKRMGVKAGVPDFLLYDTRSGYLYALEVKTAKGTLSDSQKEWKAQFDASPTGRYAVVRSTQEASQVVREWFSPQAKAAPVPFMTGPDVDAQYKIEMLTGYRSPVRPGSDDR